MKTVCPGAAGNLPMPLNHSQSSLSSDSRSRSRGPLKNRSTTSRLPCRSVPIAPSRNWRRTWSPVRNEQRLDGEADELGVEVLVDALAGALDSEAALLHAADGGRGRRRVDVVHTDHAELQPLHRVERA